MVPPCGPGLALLSLASLYWGPKVTRDGQAPLEVDGAVRPGQKASWAAACGLDVTSASLQGWSSLTTGASRFASAAKEGVSTIPVSPVWLACRGGRSHCEWEGNGERSPALRGSSPFQPPWHDALPTPTGTTTWPRVKNWLSGRLCLGDLSAFQLNVCGQISRPFLLE